MVQELWKSNRDAVTKAKELEDKIKKADDEKRLGEFVALAKSDFGNLPAKAEDLGSFMKSVEEAGDSKFIMGLLKSMNEIIATGGAITEEIGKSTTGKELDAIAEAERMANVMVEKEGVTKAKAMGNVWKSNPNLYASYLREKGNH